MGCSYDPSPCNCLQWTLDPLSSMWSAGSSYPDCTTYYVIHFSSGEKVRAVEIIKTPLCTRL